MSRTNMTFLRTDHFYGGEGAGGLDGAGVFLSRSSQRAHRGNRVPHKHDILTNRPLLAIRLVHEVARGALQVQGFGGEGAGGFTGFP